MSKIINIEWDASEEEKKNLPNSIEIPDFININDEDELSDYLSDLTGFCHYGFEIEKPDETDGLNTIWFRVGMEAKISDEEMSILTNGSDHRKAHQMMKEIICRSVLSGETYILSSYDLDGYDNPDKEVNFCFDREPLGGTKKFCIGQTYEWTDWFTGGTTRFVVKNIENTTIIMSTVKYELDGVHTQEESFTIETDENGNERFLITEYRGNKGYIYAK